MKTSLARCRSRRLPLPKHTQGVLSVGQWGSLWGHTRVSSSGLPGMRLPRRACSPPPPVVEHSAGQREEVVERKGT